MAECGKHNQKDDKELGSNLPPLDPRFETFQQVVQRNYISMTQPAAIKKVRKLKDKLFKMQDNILAYLEYLDNLANDEKLCDSFIFNNILNYIIETTSATTELHYRMWFCQWPILKELIDRVENPNKFSGPCKMTQVKESKRSTFEKVERNFREELNKMITLYQQYDDNLSSSTDNTPFIGIHASFFSSEDSDAEIHLQATARQYDTSTNIDINDSIHMTQPDHLSLENIF